MDISTLSVAQLRDLQQQIPAEIKRREAQEKVNVLRTIKEVNGGNVPTWVRYISRPSNTPKHS